MRLKANNVYISTFILIVLVSLCFFMVSCSNEQAKISEKVSDIKYYTCGMHPTVKVSVKEYEKGQTQCPICNMNLIPVKEEKKGTMPMSDMNDKEKMSSSASGVKRVTVPIEQVERAGIQSEIIKKRTLCKTIRTVGQIAYDPDMLIAQEELIAALKSMDEMKEEASPEIVDRAESLVESSKKKLRLLGLSNEQIEQLAKTRKVQEGLVLPEDKMWVYGDLYEYELGWVSIGRKVTVTSESFPGEKFYGVISAMDPVVNPKTRSVKFRAQIDNPDLKLKPQMYVDVEIQGICINKDGENKVPAVPRDSIIDTGERKIVWIDMGNGMFEGREVETGMEGVSRIDGDGREFFPVLKGVQEGEKVVTKGNFLIDSQSQITGIASSAYGGALDDNKKQSGSMVHQHQH